MVIAATAAMPPRTLAFQEVGRQAIIADPNWQSGAYYGTGKSPDGSRVVARMAAHITYLSEESMHEKFELGQKTLRSKTFGFDADFGDGELPGIWGRPSQAASMRTLSLHHQGDELFRLGGRSWRQAGGCIRGNESPILPYKLR